MKELSIVEMESVVGGGFWKKIKDAYKAYKTAKKAKKAATGDQVRDRESGLAACDSLPAGDLAKGVCETGVNIISDAHKRREEYLNNI